MATEGTLVDSRGANVQEGYDQATTIETRNSSAYRTAAIVLLIGAAMTTLFNVVFPRADDPADILAVLLMMSEDVTLRQMSFLGVTAGFLLVTAGIIAALWAASGERRSVVIRLGVYGLIAGATLFTAASGIGMAATVAATEWAAAGAMLDGAEYTVAATLNVIDDAVWAASIVVFWLSLCVAGVGMVRHGDGPRWLFGLLVPLGVANAVAIGAPILWGGPTVGLMIGFAVLAQLTIVWAVALGIWLLRGAR
jgi:hypothetical protein